MSDLNITPSSGPVISVRDSREVAIDRAKLGGANVFLRVEGEKSQNIRIKATDLYLTDRAVEFHNGAKETAGVRH